MTTTTDRRDTLDALLTELKTKLAEPGHSLLPLLGVMSHFPQYSLSNQLLILAQRPDATRVMGFNGWRKAGYQVRKGERGIAIYAPMFLKARATADGTAATATDDADQHRRLGYRVVYVFDLAQVDALPGTLPTIDTTPATAAPLTCLEQLKAHLLGHNIELVYASLPRGTYGYTDGRRITCATGQSPATEFATLAHETAHVRLHFPKDGTPKPDLTTRETEAEAIAWLLCSQLGVPGTELSVDYIKAYRGTAATLESSLERIRTTARELTAAVTAIRFDMMAARNDEGAP